MKKRLTGIILMLVIIISCVNVTGFAYSHILEDINFNSFVSSSFSSELTGAKYGSFAPYESGYPTGGFYSFTVENLDRDGDGKSLKVRRTQHYNSAKVPGMRYTLNEAATGIVYLETSMYVPSTTNSRYSPRGIMLRRMSDLSTITLFQMTEAGGRFYLYNGSSVSLTDATAPTWAPDTWYDIKIWYDLDKNDIKYYVTDDKGNVIIDTSFDGAVSDVVKSGVESLGFVNCWSFKKLYDEINTKRNDYSATDETYFDNIRIETLEYMPGSVSADYLEDFEGFGASTVQWGLPTKPSGADWSYYQYVGGGTVDGFMSVETTKGRSLKFVTAPETDKHPRLDIRYGTALTDNANFKDSISGKVSVQVPDRSIAKVFGIVTSANTQINMALFYDDGTLRMFDENLGKYKLNTWYDISYYYNASTAEYFYKVVEGDNEYIGSGVYGKAGTTPQTIWKLMIQLNNKTAKKSSYIIIDDFMMKGSMNSNADLRINKDVSVHNAQISTEQAVYARFTQKLNETAETLAGKVFSYFPNADITNIELFDDYTVRIDFSKEAGQTYRIDFKGVEDVNGNKLTDFIEFTTNLPEYVKPSVQFKNNDEKQLTSLTKGEDVNVSLKLQTGADFSKDAFAYMALYNDQNKLCAIDFVNTAFTPDGNDETLSLTVPADDGAYKVTASVWKGDMTPIVTESISTPVVIIKLDDLRAYSSNHFTEMTTWAEENDVKIGVGIIANTLEGASLAYINAVKSIDESPNAEIWCHGYTHSYSNTDGVFYSEFTDTVENQSATLKSSADILKEKCGITVRSLGTPGNYSNSDTIKAMEANPQYTTLLASASVGTLLEGSSYIHLTNWMNMESTVDVVKTLDALKANYESSSKLAPYVLVAGHSYGWDETSESTFRDFIDWLKSKDITFMTPTEYYNFAS